MENASKALIIAGGILLALITISVLLYSFNQLSWFQEKNEDKEKLEQIAKYNAEYEGYDKTVMYGTDVISVLNKAISNNQSKKATYGNEYYINVEVDVIDIEGLSKKTYSIKNDNSFINNNICAYSTNSNSIFYNFKKSVFKCTGLEYNNSGRVSKIKFEQVKVKQ